MIRFSKARISWRFQKNELLNRIDSQIFLENTKRSNVKAMSTYSKFLRRFSNIRDVGGKWKEREQAFEDEYFWSKVKLLLSYPADVDSNNTQLTI